MTGIRNFLKAVQSIVAKAPTYKSGGTGSDGTCDCVGLVMGAMYACGHSRYALHGSNYFARNQMATLDAISSEADCFTGMVVFKAKEPGESGYSLPDRYKAGGQYYNGDLQDYYHVGVVTSTAPFCITHCTSTGGANGITTDSKLGKWGYGGQLKDVDYETEEEETVSQKAMVIADNGKPVNLRKSPSASAERIAKVPVGSEVDVITSTSDWATVEWNGHHGYMMTKYLQMAEEQADTADEAQSSDLLGKMEEMVAKLDDILTELDALQAVIELLLEQNGETEG